MASEAGLGLAAARALLKKSRSSQCIAPAPSPPTLLQDAWESDAPIRNLSRPASLATLPSPATLQKAPLAARHRPVSPIILHSLDLPYDNDNLDLMAEHSLAAIKQRAERAESELSKASARTSELRLEIKTLHGRSTAFKLASGEASREGRSWDVGDCRRFSMVSKGPPDFACDGLREMLDQARRAVDRRMCEAISEAAKARAESERAGSEGELNLEAAFAKCKEPVAELACRTCHLQEETDDADLPEWLRLTLTGSAALP